MEYSNKGLSRDNHTKLIEVHSKFIGVHLKRLSKDTQTKLIKGFKQMLSRSIQTKDIMYIQTKLIDRHSKIIV